MKIFANPEHQAHYESEGYIVADFFSKEEVQEMLDFWKKSPHHFDEGKFTSVHSWPPELNAQLSKRMHEISQPKIDQLMPGWKGDGVAYIVKGPASDKPSDFKLHQDFNMLDETIAPSFGLWVALVDISQENGGLYVLPGSHNKFKGTIRSSTNPSLHMEVVPEIVPHLKNINIRAGQACIFAHSLFHGSPSNRSRKERPILHMGVFPNEAKSYHYYKVKDDTGAEAYEILEIDRTFYYTKILEFIGDPKASPHKVVGVLRNYRPTPTEAEVLEAYKNEPPVVQDDIPLQKGWLARLGALFRAR